MSDEITFDDLLEALKDMDGSEAAGFLSSAGVELRPTATTFTPICISCGGIKHDMVLIQEHTGDGEDREMIFCHDCAESHFCEQPDDPNSNYKPHSSYVVPLGVGVTHEKTEEWRDREESLRLAMEWIGDDDKGPYVGEMFVKKDGDLALRHPHWDEWSEDLEPIPGTEEYIEGKIEMAALEEEPEEDSNDKPKRVRA
jgi:hypothetical protein